MIDFSRYETMAADVDQSLKDGVYIWKHNEEDPEVIGGIFLSMKEEENPYPKGDPVFLVLRLETPDGGMAVKENVNWQLKEEIKLSGAKRGDEILVKWLGLQPVIGAAYSAHKYAVRMVKKAETDANDLDPKGSKRISSESTEVSASASSDDDFVDDLPDVEDSTKNTKKQGDLLLDAATDEDLPF